MCVASIFAGRFHDPSVEQARPVRLLIPESTRAECKFQISSNKTDGARERRYVPLGPAASDFGANLCAKAQQNARLSGGPTFTGGNITRDTQTESIAAHRVRVRVLCVCVSSGPCKSER